MRAMRFIVLGIAIFLAIIITPLAVGKVSANWQPQHLAANIIPNQFSVNANTPNVTLPTIQSELQAQNSGTGKFCNLHPPNGGWFLWVSENSTDPCQYGLQQCPGCRIVSQGTYLFASQNQISLTCSGFSQTFQGMGREPLNNAFDTAANRQLNACIFAVGALPPQPQNRPNNSSSSSTASNWLDRVNYLRSLANLPPVSNNPEWTQGAIEHSRYVVKTDQVTHVQDPNNPWYTPAGAEAGKSGNVFGWGSTQKQDVDFIDGWMLGPFHGLGIIDPRLTQVAYGSYSEADGGIEEGATLVIRGINFNSSPQYPIIWPANGKTVPFRELGGETPNPITGVGYSYPAGMPIYLQLGPGNITPNVTFHSLTRDNTPIEHAVFDETNFQTGANERGWQATAISILDGRDAVVMIPKKPLKPGNYTASITANGQNYTWSFDVV